jgi:ADP-heptose:LPS heptosyltransferase
VGRVLEDLPQGARVAVIRLRSLGDCVLTTPALAILRGFRPDLHVSIVVDERFKEIFEGNSDLDEIIPADLNRLRRARPHLCLNLHGGTRSAWMTALSGARHRAGFGHFRNQVVYNLRIPRAQEILGIERTVHTAEHLASVIFYLGAPRVKIPGAKLVTARDPLRPSAGWQVEAPAPPGCVVIHPVAAARDKTWAAEKFLEVARHLEASGTQVVFIGGAADDLSAFRAFRSVQGAPLGAIKSLLAGAPLFIGNDSGPAHMAAAFGVPSVVLFGSSDPAIWGPWRTHAEVLTSREGIAGIRAAQVIEAVARLRVHA